MTNQISAEDYNRRLTRMEVLQELLNEAQLECQKEMTALQQQVRDGATTGHPALDYVILETMRATVDHGLLKLVENCMKAFRGKSGQLFLIRREVATSHVHTGSFQGSGVENVSTVYMCGRFGAGAEGMTVWNDRPHPVALRVVTDRHLEVWPGTHEFSAAKEGPIRIFDIQRSAWKGGAGYCRSDGEMVYWIGDDNVRRQLAAIGVNPARVETVLATVPAPPQEAPTDTAP